MAKQNNTLNLDSDATLRRLRLEVERAAGATARTPKQFDALAETIYARTGVLLSPTTLKRIWAYLREPVKPRRTTLDVLAQFCGWRDFADFDAGCRPEVESGNVSAKAVRAGKDINIGGRIRLFWAPARVCEIEFIGGAEWRVVAAERTRLSAGDTFTCPLIVAGEPLYLDNLRHNGSRPGVYVCGRIHGITFIQLS